jgi:hypothetical protein
MVLFMGAVIVNAQTIYSIDIKDLPKVVTSSIAKDFPGFKIMSATKTVDKNTTTYDVTAVKKDVRYILKYDSNGNLLKKTEKSTKHKPGKSAKVPTGKS